MTNLNNASYIASTIVAWGTRLAELEARVTLADEAVKISKAEYQHARDTNCKYKIELCDIYTSALTHKGDLKLFLASQVDLALTDIKYETYD